MRYLKTNTATTITVGPFLDKTDGITPETGITVTGIHITLMVDNAGSPTLAVDADATASGGNNDMAHITNDDAGYYSLELTAANLNYLGGALLSLNVVGTACPVFHEFMILPANAYDAMVSGSGVGVRADVQGWLGTAPATPTVNGVPEVDVTHFGGTGGTFSSGRAEVNTTHAAGTAWGSGAITAASIATGAITNAKFAAGAIDAAAIATGAIDADSLAADAGTEIGTAVWATTTRILTASTNLGDLDDAVLTILGTPAGASMAADIAAVSAKTTNLPSDPADASVIAGRFDTVDSAIDALPTAAEIFAATLTTQLTEAYAADGTAPTLAQAIFLIQQSLHEFAISGTTRTVKKLDGTTTAATFTLDDATAPTSTTRSS